MSEKIDDCITKIIGVLVCIVMVMGVMICGKFTYDYLAGIRHKEVMTYNLTFNNDDDDA